LYPGSPLSNFTLSFLKTRVAASILSLSALILIKLPSTVVNLGLTDPLSDVYTTSDWAKSKSS